MAPDVVSPAPLPSFITAAPRIVVGQEDAEAQPQVAAQLGAESAGGLNGPAERSDAHGEGRFPSRGRRRRLRSPYGFHAGSNDEDTPTSPAGPDETPVSD